MTECEYYQQLISQRLDGELTAAQEHELAEHLSRCADCRAVDAAFRALSEGFADCGHGSADARAFERVDSVDAGI